MMPARIRSRFTPRQRAAIKWPSDPREQVTHPRYHRVTAPFQTILTFDLDPEEEGKPRAARWHARATTFPAKPLHEWNDNEKIAVRAAVGRLVGGVGGGATNVVKGSEPIPSSLHVFRSATKEEIAFALAAMATRVKPS